MSDRIDHAEKARIEIEWLHEWMEREGDTEATHIAQAIEAQTHATLALVEQQRIANLIALAQVRVGATDLPIFRHLVMEPSGAHDVRPTAAIREGLGL